MIQIILVTHMTKSAKRPKKTTDNDFKKLIEQYKDEKG